MKRIDFIKSLGVLPFLPAASLPAILSGKESDMRVWSAGFWGFDKSLHIGASNDGAEQFFITYRKMHDEIMVPSYGHWKDHYIPRPKESTKDLYYPKDYREMARGDWLVRELQKDFNTNKKRYPNPNIYDLETPKLKQLESEYFARMAKWCERMAKQFRSISAR